MQQIRCSLAYHETPNDQLKTFAEGVGTGYIGNPTTFTVQPYTAAVWAALVGAYDTTYTAYENGGEAQKGAFLLAKAALMDALDELAEETDEVADGDGDKIILACFTPTKAPGETVKPGQCVVEVKRGIAGELVTTCAKVEYGKHYGCIMVTGAPLPAGIVVDGNGRIALPAGTLPNTLVFDLNDQREKHFTDLIHDTTYYFYYYAVNAKGVGPLSEVVSMVCW